MDITLTKDCILTPFGITNCSIEGDLMAPSELASERVAGTNGDVDFGVTLKCREFTVTGIISYMSPLEKQLKLDTLKGQLYECLNYQKFTNELDSSVQSEVKLLKKPEIVNKYPLFLEIALYFKAKPYYTNVYSEVVL